MKIGILGATGAVGRQMLICLREQNIVCEEIRLFASERSVGKLIDGIPVQAVTVDGFNGLDVVLGAVSASLSRLYAPLIAKSGALYIDNSRAFRMDPEVPLVVPEINGEDAKKHHGIIANPNCSTIIAAMAMAPLCKLAELQAVYASTYQAVSGAGNKGMQELSAQIRDISAGKEAEISVFPRQIAYNVIAEIGAYSENGYTDEEMKMQNEGRKILHIPDLRVTCTCVRVPVYRSHAISLSCIFDRPVAVEDAKAAIAAFPGVEYKEEVPCPLDTSNQDIVYAGRLRKDLCNDNGLTLWCCGDQIRKGAAANAVEILRCL